MQNVWQCARTYVQTATGAVAQGVQAAGIDIALPCKIGTLVAMIQDVSSFGGLPEAMVHDKIPPFIVDTWLSVLQ